MALAHFDHARCDEKVRKEACVNMIEIYLRLDDYNFWTAAIEKAAKVSAPVISSLNALIQELSDIGGDRCKIETFQGYFKLLELGDSDNTENAFKIFASILESKRVSAG